MGKTYSATEGQPESRPTLYITYAYDDPDSAPVLDVSSSLAEARGNVQSGAWEGFCYRVKLLADGFYGQGEFIERIAQKT